MMLFKDLKIPENSILGVNYSGMHDTSVAIVDETGSPIFASSLERFSRHKQDGRPPIKFFEEIPWDKIGKLAISTEEYLKKPKFHMSNFLEVKTPERKHDNSHQKKFYEFFNTVPCKKIFVCHQMAHASSAFWHSPYKNSLCLTYDGGMLNSPWFGGVYLADHKKGIENIEHFSSAHYAKITSLYTFVTSLLGFSPMRHEGKITGLAALGNTNQKIFNILDNWFRSEFLEMEKCLNWHFIYSHNNPPVFVINEAEIKYFKDQIVSFKKEDVAATLQKYTEDHLLSILKKIVKSTIKSQNICLAGGLFANVKLNQKIYESSFFKNVFIAPAMTDDGTALGAAWHVVEKKVALKKNNLNLSMYLGNSNSSNEIKKILQDKKINFLETRKPHINIASLLAKGNIVAVFQGPMEFGPRALGNRSILCQAIDKKINLKLNNKLNRTEFMPFAPVTRLEDASKYYKDTNGVIETLQYMTITLNCSEEMIRTCPAVVHVDNTARPQLVSEKNNKLLHNILTEYSNQTNIFSLVNTSFNTHEEPMVCNIEDALTALFSSGIDYLYVDGGILISLKENKDIGYDYVKNKIKHSDKSMGRIDLLNLFSFKNKSLGEELEKKEKEIKSLKKEVEINEKQLEEKETAIHEKEEEINRLSYYISSSNSKGEFNSESFLVRLDYAVKKFILHRLVFPFKQIFLPKLGLFNQYFPRKLVLPNLNNQYDLKTKPKISLVVPSLNQGSFIKKTIESILCQKYENKEIFIVDGKSSDNTLEVIKGFNNKIRWVSEKDKGQADAINKGFKRCNGEIMAWINSDDIYFSNTFETVIKYFEDNPDVDVIYGNRIIINEFDQDIGRWVLPKHDNNVIDWVDFIPQETLFWKRSIWEKVDQKLDISFQFALDWDLLLRFKKAQANFLHIPHFLSGFRVHKDQKTNLNIASNGVHEMNILRKRSLGYIPSQNKIKKNIIFYLIKHILADIRYLFDIRIKK